MSNFSTAAPQFNLTGIKDQSIRAPIREAEQIPTHLPHVLIFAEKGPTVPHLAVGGGFTTLYGSKTLDPRSPYYNHQSELTATIIGEANAVFVERLKPDDAGPNARLLLSLDIVPDQIQQYQRNVDQSYKLDVNGARIPVTGAGAKIPGHRARWVINDWKAGQTVQDFGAVTSKVGSLTSATDVQSTCYPIMELEASFFGAYGNNLGLRLVAPTTESNNPLNDTTATAVKAFLYRLSLVNRLDAASTVNVSETLGGEQSIDFTFKPGAVDPASDTEISLEDIFLPSYQDVDTPGVTQVYGPFGKLKVYDSNLATVLAMVAEREAPLGLLPEITMDEDSEWLHFVNVINATDEHGVPYYSFELEGAAQNGIRFTEATAVWAEGGSDGTMTFESHDALVQNAMLNYGNTGADLLDDAKFPFSYYYDSGYTLDTKLALLSPLGFRKDVGIILSTQDVSQPLNSAAIESSMAITLKNAARLYPESEIHGTKVCRAVVVGHAGDLINSKYKGPNGNKHLPVVLEFAAKAARYMGAGSGYWNSAAAFDMPPNNQIEKFKNLNVTFKPASQRVNDWKNGLVWAQSYDMRSIFWPAIQTVYDDDTSILNSFFNVAIAIDLEKVSQRAWRDLTGISGKMTKAQFIQRSNQLILDRTEGKYDGRVTIRPDTYFTAGDDQRGYSWKTDIHMYGENMRTVGTYTVVAHRSSDLEIAG